MEIDLESKCTFKGKSVYLRLATNSVAVQVNRSRRLPNVLHTCTICGMDKEDGYHAVILQCTIAKDLRQEARNI
jgi:hypothetical protein